MLGTDPTQQQSVVGVIFRGSYKYSVRDIQLEVGGGSIPKFYKTRMKPGMTGCTDPRGHVML